MLSFMFSLALLVENDWIIEEHEYATYGDCYAYQMTLLNTLYSEEFVTFEWDIIPCHAVTNKP